MDNTKSSSGTGSRGLELYSGGNDCFMTRDYMEDAIQVQIGQVAASPRCARPVIGPVTIYTERVVSC